MMQTTSTSIDVMLLCLCDNGSANNYSIRNRYKLHPTETSVIKLTWPCLHNLCSFSWVKTLLYSNILGIYTARHDSVAMQNNTFHRRQDLTRKANSLFSLGVWIHRGNKINTTISSQVLTTQILPGIQSKPNLFCKFLQIRRASIGQSSQLEHR